MDKKTLNAVLRDPVTRRQFLSTAGMTTGLLLAGQIAASAQVGVSSKLPSFPFTLGVASGDPTPGGIVLWTRLAPNPDAGAWNATASRAVQYQVALDEGFRQLVRQGTALALPQEAHSVHVELVGLQPGATYFYRFLIDGYVSRTGRTKTAPAAGAALNALTFAFCSSSDFQNGYFGAYRAMASENIDFWVHLGDYIYEYDAKNSRSGYNPANDNLPTRQHSQTAAQATPTATGLDQLTVLSDYRNRHAQYKQDPDLQLLHASAALIPVWDDHEVENNYANDVDDAETPFTPAAQFLLQRAAAYQAYYEHMPIRRGFILLNGDGTPRWQDAQLYRNFTFGNLMTLHMLDTRQYRTDQVVPNPFPGIGDFSFTLPAGGNPTGTLMGDTQETWLKNNISNATTRWNVIGQQVMMAQFNFGAAIPIAQGGDKIWNVDQWDGYGAARQRLLDFFGANTAKNVVVLTGDIHSAWVHDLKANFANPNSATVATELICSSITADFPNTLWQAAEGAAQFFSPWTKYLRARKRGYVLCTATQTTFRADFRYVTSSPTTGQVIATNAAPSTDGSYVVQNGVPGAIPA